MRRIVVFPPSQSARTPRGPLESMRLWMTRRVRLGTFRFSFLHGCGGSQSVFRTCFFFVSKYGKQRFFQIIPWWFAWKPRTPVKGKGSERSYFYVPVEVDKKRQKLLLTSEGSCCFTGKKTTPISVEKFVVETNMCHFFLHWKHFLVSLCFGIGSYFCGPHFVLFVGWTE